MALVKGWTRVSVPIRVEDKQYLDGIARSLGFSLGRAASKIVEAYIHKRRKTHE